MSKIKVLQQVLNPSGSGGVSAEYRALQNSSLVEQYIFEPMILMDCHNGISLKDIMFYYKKIQSFYPDIIHVRGAGPDGLNAVIAAKLSKKGKILVTVHGMYSDLVYINPLKRWISKNIIERLTFRMADGISCVCNAADKRHIFDRYRKKMLPFVYNRIPDYNMHDKQMIKMSMRQQLHISSDTIVGVYVGRVTKEKGLEYLKATLRKMDANWPVNFVMLIIGEGQYLEEFRRCCNDLKHKENVKCLGNQTDIYRFLFASDFFVLPSLHENHSISLLEATAAKLPIITTNVGGNAEIVKENGILIEPRNAEELLVALETMICNEKRMKYQERLQISRTEEFENKNVDKALHLVYQELMKRE